MACKYWLNINTKHMAKRRSFVSRLLSTYTFHDEPSLPRIVGLISWNKTKKKKAASKFLSRTLLQYDESANCVPLGMQQCSAKNSSHFGSFHPKITNQPAKQRNTIIGWRRSHSLCLSFKSSAIHQFKLSNLIRPEDDVK